jgi:S1-C subfamily serine protease
MTRFGILFLLTLTLFSAPVYDTYAASTSKKTEPETSIPKALADATVNLYCRFKVGKTYVSTSGSGVFISSLGVILTNAHVAQYFLVPVEKSLVKGSCTVRTGSRAKDRYTASVLYFPSMWAKTHIVDAKKEATKGTGEHDFALLYVTGASKGVLPPLFPSLSLDTSAQAIEGATVTILGYPTESLTFDEVRSKLILVSALSTIKSSSGFDTPHTDLITLTDSEAGSSGISGGPVLSSANTIIGIATTKSTAENSRSLRAITISYIERVLQGDKKQSLATLLASDFANMATTTFQSLPESTLKVLTQRLLKNRRK